MAGHTGSAWGGRRAQAWSAAVLELHRGPNGEAPVCWLQLDGCTRVATTADHVVQRRDRPDLAYVVENGRPACRACNSKRKGTPVHRLARIGGTDAVTIDASAFFDR